MRYFFTKELYNKEALLRAAYSFTDIAYVHLDADKDNYIADIEMKEAVEPDKITELDFQNEILAQMVRENISKQTKNVRELMLARAFSSTIVTSKSCTNYNCADNINEDIGKSTILMDWFEKYE